MIAEEFQLAVNTQDFDSAMTLLADDSILLIAGDQVTKGKAEMRDWFEAQSALNFQFEGVPVVLDTGVSIAPCLIHSDAWSYFKLEEMTGSCELDITDGKITSFKLLYDEDTSTRLAESAALPISALYSIWTSPGVPPGGDTQSDWVNFYMQFMGNGEARISLAPESLQSDPNPDHPGVKLAWSFDGFMLTITNLGDASEGYCSAQDLGMYLVRSDGTGGIQFKPIQEDCLWRRFTLQRLGKSWDLYLPQE
jgi:hypothetical protein